MDLCDGLLQCHSGCGFGPGSVVLHLDVKPSNVLLRRDRDTGRLVAALGDFGVSKLYPARVGSVAATGTIYGTAGYIAPELTEGCHPSPESDAYAVGITILQVGAAGSCCCWYSYDFLVVGPTWLFFARTPMKGYPFLSHEQGEQCGGGVVGDVACVKKLME
jgi:serine/threonine protein kinase